MLIARNLSELRFAQSQMGPVALVPTMGALHDGHLALMQAARAAGGPVAASIFVNPLQFGPSEDFARYPRDDAGDIAKLEGFGCDLLWMPDIQTMYPPDAATTISVAGPAIRWEGEARPGHFGGVATVVTKLFMQLQPHSAFFGEKDYQQLQVIRRVVADLLLPVKVVGVPTVREPDGLALSSRNRFLTPENRAAAPALYAALMDAAKHIQSGSPVQQALDWADGILADSSMDTDYLAMVDPVSLAPLSQYNGPARLIATVRLGSVRLLDNVAV